MLSTSTIHHTFKSKIILASVRNPYGFICDWFSHHGLLACNNIIKRFPFELSNLIGGFVQIRQLGKKKKKKKKGEAYI